MVALDVVVVVGAVVLLVDVVVRETTAVLKHRLGHEEYFVQVHVEEIGQVLVVLHGGRGRGKGQGGNKVVGGRGKERRFHHSCWQRFNKVDFLSSGGGGGVSRGGIVFLVFAFKAEHRHSYLFDILALCSNC